MYRILLMNDFDWNVCSKNSEFYKNAFKTVDTPSLISFQTSTTFFSLCHINDDMLNGFGVNDDRLMNSDLTQVH